MSAPLTFGTEGPEDQTFGYELSVVPKAGIGDQAKGPTDDRSPESVDDQLGDLAGFAQRGARCAQAGFDELVDTHPLRLHEVERPRLPHDGAEW